jgi:regulation of enolase protein 1 (concanavalin A-like superfamily)
MSEFTLPKLTSLHVSSAKAIPQDQISIDLPTTMTYNQPITIRAQPKTDLWRKPPHTDVDNAPTVLISSPIDINKFYSARVTINANWNTLYDQGGLILFIPVGNTTTWLKTGIEFFDGKPYVGTVATDSWSDWSLVPLGKEKGGKVTIQVERQVKEGKKVNSLWVYIIDEEKGEKVAIRQITSWFWHEENLASELEDNRHILVGVYAARPTVPAGEGRENEELVVNFEGFEVKLFDD